jgi:hypothetical protein
VRAGAVVTRKPKWQHFQMLVLHLTICTHAASNLFKTTAETAAVHRDQRVSPNFSTLGAQNEPDLPLPKHTL